MIAEEGLKPGDRFCSENELTRQPGGPFINPLSCIDTGDNRSGECQSELGNRYIGLVFIDNDLWGASKVLGQILSR